MMDGILPSSSTSNGNTKVINNYFTSSNVAINLNREYSLHHHPGSTDYYVDQGTIDCNPHHHPNNFETALSSDSHYQSYLTTESVSFYDQSQVLTSRLSQINLSQASNNINAQQSQQSQKSHFNDSLHSSKLPNASSRNDAAIGTHQDQSNQSLFSSDSIRQELIKRSTKSQEIATDAALDSPAKVDVFIELVRIEPISGASSFTFNGMISTVYKATNSETGEIYCLRRFHGFQPNTANAKLLMSTIESWKRFHHPNIVTLRQVFTTKAFGDNSVIFVYDYHPFSETFMSHYFSNQLISISGHSSSVLNGYSTSSRPFSQQQNTRKFLSEQTIWNYIIQISSALRTIHQSNLAFRSLDPSKIMLTSGWDGYNNRGRDARIKLSFVGVFDILTLDTFPNNSNNSRAYIQHLQQEDLVLFGRLCLALSTNCLSAFTQRDNLQKYVEMLPHNYSTDLRNLITYFIAYKTNGTNKLSIDDIMPMIGARFYMQLDHFYLRYDHLYEELSKEIDNGRLLRLLSKLGTINERPEHQLDPNWSETGDRYMLKLFRDYLFHQFDENGKPWLDLGHIISNLNKFDVGSPEKICLISRDAQNVIIVSFEELKRCFESAINDLMQ
ncbi:PAN2-PAN3 deadenylation complex subunit pan3 [Sarcoptes scabiei]|uniref:PAN2-PAN3 deadenylation complex subunit PAN3 n=2 Tax=Sarcoptes scabiei TaxID=52283 RepID=A0A834RBM1_SARSC|nr:PAN2-PAN3 deadenylation complex subunit pan3 [Sarcoptes scabiei]